MKKIVQTRHVTTPNYKNYGRALPLEINNLEEKWQNLQIAIYPKGYSKDTLTNEQKFHFVHKELSDKELPAKDKSKEDYEIDF